MLLKDRVGWCHTLASQMYDEKKKWTLEQRVSEKLGRAECISEAKRFMRNVWSLLRSSSWVLQAWRSFCENSEAESSRAGTVCS